jgi:hypothetical protein
MMETIRRRWAKGLVLACGLVAGCDTDRIVRVSTMPDAEPVFENPLTAVGPRQDYPVRILGNPFGIDQRRFEALVVGLMQAESRTGRVRFVASRDVSSDEVFAVLVFNPAEGVPNAFLCSGSPVRTLPPRKSVELESAACGGGLLNTLGGLVRLTVSADGDLPRVEGPDDPAFRDLIHAVTQTLFSRTAFPNNERH